MFPLSLSDSGRLCFFQNCCFLFSIFSFVCVHLESSVFLMEVKYFLAELAKHVHRAMLQSQSAILPAVFTCVDTFESSLFYLSFETLLKVELLMCSTVHDQCIFLREVLHLYVRKYTVYMQFLSVCQIF